MFAPLRSVMAEQFSSCAMDEMSTMSSENLLHQMHLSQTTVDVSVSEPQASQQSTMQHDCCCCDGDNCASDCHMGMAASLFFQFSSYTPVYVNAANIALYASDLLVRALTPPSRPPFKRS